MTKEDASELCTAVRGKEIYLDTDYHVGFFFHFYECSVYSLTIA